MAENQYHFVDRWRVQGDVKEVADILEDALALLTAYVCTLGASIISLYIVTPVLKNKPREQVLPPPPPPPNFHSPEMQKLD